MGANQDITGFAELDCGGHDERIAGMKAAGYIGDVDVWDDGGIWAAGEVSEAFPEVDIEESFASDGPHVEYLLSRSMTRSFRV